MVVACDRTRLYAAPCIKCITPGRQKTVQLVRTEYLWSENVRQRDLLNAAYVAADSSGCRCRPLPKFPSHEPLGSASQSSQLPAQPNRLATLRGRDGTYHNP